MHICAPKESKKNLSTTLFFGKLYPLPFQNQQSGNYSSCTQKHWGFELEVLLFLNSSHTYFAGLGANMCTVWMPWKRDGPKVCTDIHIYIIATLLLFYDARWLFATGVNTYASDRCFVLARPLPFWLHMSGQAPIGRANCVALLKLMPILFFGKTDKKTSVRWQRSQKSHQKC